MSSCAVCHLPPPQVDVHNNLGDLWRAQGGPGRLTAQACYMDALKVDPRYAPAWRGLGDLFREGADWGQVGGWWGGVVWVLCVSE